MTQHDRTAFIGGSDPQMSARVETVRRLYCECGMSQLEIAAEIGVSQSLICIFMKRFGIKARVAAKRDQSREKNSTWKGAAVKYKPAHNRVYAARGKPKICERCGSTDPSKRYEWANKTGKYDDPEDYMRLCRSCHCKHDGLIKNLGNYANVASKQS